MFELVVPEWVWIVLAGLAGGLINAVRSSQGITIPYREINDRGRTTWFPGAIGNIMTGGATGLVLWLVYSPSADFGSLNVSAKAIGASLVAGMGGSVFLDRILEREALNTTVKDSGIAIEQAGATIEELEARIEHMKQVPGRQK